jgi:hypothetical protein
MPEALPQSFNTIWRTLDQGTDSPNCSQSLLLTNPVELDCLDIDKGLHGVVLSDCALDLTCRAIVDVINRPTLFRNPFKQLLAIPILQIQFFPLDTKSFRDNHDHDDYLCKALLIQYHLRILEKLLEFGQTRQAQTLLLIFAGETLVFEGIYQAFASSSTSKGRFNNKQTCHAIDASPATLNQIIKVLYDHEQTMRQTLWRGQKGNYTFHRYLTGNFF